jgi:hypothetical protein
MLLNIGTAIFAFGIFAIALENTVLAVICFGLAGWVLS